MIRFVPTCDPVIITQIMTHPKVVGNMTHGSVEDIKNFQPPMQPYILKLLVYDGAELLGLLYFVAHSTVCWEQHTCLLPNAWGARSNRVFKSLQTYVWSSLANIQRVILVIPESNKSALACAKRNGLIQFGYNPKSLIRDGVLMGQYFFGISRPEGA